MARRGIFQVRARLRMRHIDEPAAVDGLEYREKPIGTQQCAPGCNIDVCSHIEKEK